MKKLGLLIILVLLILVLLVGIILVIRRVPECGISETLVLENTTDAPVTHLFTRGAHEGFVTLLPGQTITVDVVRCK